MQWCGQVFYLQLFLLIFYLTFIIAPVADHRMSQGVKVMLEFINQNSGAFLVLFSLIVTNRNSTKLSNFKTFINANDYGEHLL